MTSNLADSVKKTIYNDIQNSDFLGIICDESCDVTNLKQLIIYFTYVKEGTAKTSFVTIVSIDDGKADTIVDAIKAVIQDLDVSIEKVVGIGTDGAAVMTGHKNGVAVKLQNSGATYLTQIHCAAHRVSLALSQAAKSSALVHDVEIILSQVYRFFDDSPVRASALRLINEINENPNIKLKEPKQIRWLGLYEAIDAALKSYPGIVQTLEHLAERANDVNSVKSKGLLKKLKSFNFVFLLSVVLDIIEPVKKLSSVFQYQNVNFSKIEPMVKCTIDALNDLKCNQGENELRFFKNFYTDSEGNTLYQGIKVSKHQSIDEINTVKVQYLDQVVNNLQNRFPSETLNVLEALNAIFNPKKYPECKNDLNTYGQKEISILMDKYSIGDSPLINKDILEKNFKFFKLLTFNFKSFEMRDYIKLLISDYKDEFPEFIKLAKVAITIPISSADAERGFSCMKRIKTDQRNRLKESKLQDLMMISLEGPPLTEAKNIIESANEIFFRRKRSGGSNI